MCAEVYTGGLFQQYRPNGIGVDREFAGVDSADEYVSRLSGVYQATRDPECARDMYFIVRRPLASSQAELCRLGDDLVGGLRELCPLIDSAELTTYLGSIAGSTCVPIGSLDQNQDENLMVLEEVGDWFRSSFVATDRLHELREAYWTVACNFFLIYFLTWPSLRSPQARDVFRPYFELWRRGAAVAFAPHRLEIAIPLIA